MTKRNQPSAVATAIGADAGKLAAANAAFLADTEVAFFKESGATFARNERSRVKLAEELGGHLCIDGNLKAPIPYAVWELARKAWIEGASAQGYADAGAFWLQTIKLGQSMGVIPAKPEAPSPEAARKRTERAALDAKSAETLAKEAEAAAKAGKLIEAGRLAAAAERREKSDKRAAAKAAHDATASTQEKIRAALKRLDGNKEALAQVLALVLKLSPEPKKTTPPGTSVKGRKGTPVTA
jgi:hypothetical protein